MSHYELRKLRLGVRTSEQEWRATGLRFDPDTIEQFAVSDQEEYEAAMEEYLSLYTEELREAVRKDGKPDADLLDYIGDECGSRDISDYIDDLKAETYCSEEEAYRALHETDGDPEDAIEVIAREENRRRDEAAARERRVEEAAENLRASGWTDEEEIAAEADWRIQQEDFPDTMPTWSKKENDRRLEEEAEARHIRWLKERLDAEERDRRRRVRLWPDEPEPEEKESTLNPYEDGL